MNQKLYNHLVKLKKESNCDYAYILNLSPLMEQLWRGELPIPFPVTMALEEKNWKYGPDALVLSQNWDDGSSVIPENHLVFIIDKNILAGHCTTLWDI